MGAQTIRDVLIKIGIEADTRGYRAPDFRKVQAEADAAKKSVDDLAAAVNKVGKGGFGGTGPGGGGRAGTGSNVGGTQTPTSQYFGDANIGVGRYGNKFGRQDRFNQQILGGGSDDLVLRRSETLAKIGERQAILEKDELRRSRLLMEVDNQRAEALNGLAMGAMKVARGAAFVTAASTEEYQAMLKLVAQAQGYFDLVSGGIDIYKNLTNLKKAATAATLAEAAAEGTLAAAKGRSAVASGVANAGGGLSGFLGTRGIGGLAVRAGIPLAVAYGVGRAAAYGIGEASGSNRLSREDALRDSRMDVLADARENIVSRSRSKVDRHFEGILAGVGSNAADREYDIRRNRLSQDEAIRRIDSETADERFKILNRPKQVGDARTSSYENAKQDQAIAELEKRAEEEKLKVLEGQDAAMRRQWATSQGLLRTTQDTLQAEKDRYTGMEERFGRLDPARQGRLTSIAAKRQRGESLTRADVEALDQAGAGGSSAVSQFYRSAAKQGGFEQFAGAFGEDAGLRQAQQAARHAADVAKETGNEVVEAFGKIAASRQAADEKVLSLARTLVKANEALQDQIDRLAQDAQEAAAGRVKSQGIKLQARL